MEDLIDTLSNNIAKAKEVLKHTEITSSTYGILVNNILDSIKLLLILKGTVQQETNISTLS